jgi:hypothetical protein
MERYSTMYPRGQPGLPDDPVTAYVDSLRATSIVPGSITTRREPTARCHGPTRECNVCVAPASSSSKSEHAPRHRGADAQRRARLNELVEARRQLDEELALLRSALTSSLAIDNLRRACPCRETTIDASRGTSLFRESPAMRTATGESAAQPQPSHTTERRHHPRTH